MKKREFSRETIELADGKMCDLVSCEVEGYGLADYAENIEVSNGDFRRSRSMIPFNHLDAYLSKFKWDIYGCDVSLEKAKAESFGTCFHEYQKEGRWLYIYSKTKGSGKTFLACALANEIMNTHDICAKFISVPELMEMTKDGYRDFARKEGIEQIRKAELLILDDIGTETKKEWVDMELFRLIDCRSSSRKVTVFTSNVEMDMLKIDDRIVDRIHELSVKIHLPEVPIRAMDAEKKNMEFVQRVLKNNAGTY